MLHAVIRTRVFVNSNAAMAISWTDQVLVHVKAPSYGVAPQLNAKVSLEKRVNLTWLKSAHESH